MRITELEDQGLQFKKDQHELRGKCTMLGNQLQRMKEEKGSKQFINPNVFKVFVFVQLNQVKQVHLSQPYSQIENKLSVASNQG